MPQEIDIKFKRLRKELNHIPLPSYATKGSAGLDIYAALEDLGIDEFLLVQWLAPLASEAPEFVVVALFAWRGDSTPAFSTLISLKVNQWTLLVGVIPIAYTLSSGGTAGLPLDARQTEEMILTSAQSLQGAVLIADLRFGRNEAIALALLFVGQFFFTSTEVRYYFSILYLLVAAALLLKTSRRRNFLSLVFSSPFARRTPEP